MTNETALREALARQCENMAFVLNRASLPDQWYSKFMRELESDKAALLQSPSQPVVADAVGGFVCPICGKDESHHHGPAVVQAWRNTTHQRLIEAAISQAFSDGAYAVAGAYNIDDPQTDYVIKQAFDPSEYAHPQASPPPVQGEVTQYSEQALADGCIDFLEERSVEWMADGGVQRMFNAIASVFEKYAPQEIMDRFREKLGAIGQQCYVEGSLRVWEEISAQQRALGAPLPQNPDRIAHSQTDTQEGEVEAHEIDDIIEVAISEGMEDDDWTAFSIARRVHEGLAHNGLAVTAIASPQHGDAAQQQEQQP